MINWKRSRGEPHEDPCHESNDTLPGMLSAARAERPPDADLLGVDGTIANGRCEIMATVPDALLLEREER